MARNMLLVLFAVATLLHGSAAQTRHVVGDATGWTIPPGGASTYTTWASNKTFTVGDTLVFNFVTGQHDVVKVAKSGYDGCNGGSAIWTLNSGPATVTLNETGEQYYICTFGSHCSAGQKLAINVARGASNTPSPAPQPSGRTSPSPSPVPNPTEAPAPAPQATRPTTPPAAAPGPSSRSVTYTVGGAGGWIVPNGNASFYSDWAAGKNFKVGDVLVFNYALNTHNVEEVTKANFDSCNSASPIATYTTPPARVTLTKSGEHYYICGIPGHCLGAQKLAINVTGSSIAVSPTSPNTPSSLSPGGSVSPPPDNSSAPSLPAVGLFATLLSVTAAFFF